MWRSMRRVPEINKEVIKPMLTIYKTYPICLGNLATEYKIIEEEINPRIIIIFSVNSFKWISKSKLLKIEKILERGIFPETSFKKKYKHSTVVINIDTNNKKLTGLVNLFIVRLKDLNKININMVIPKGNIGRKIERLM